MIPDETVAKACSKRIILKFEVNQKKGTRRTRLGLKWSPKKKTLPKVK